MEILSKPCLRGYFSAKKIILPQCSRSEGYDFQFEDIGRGLSLKWFTGLPVTLVVMGLDWSVTHMFSEFLFVSACHILDSSITMRHAPEDKICKHVRADCRNI